MESIKSNLFEKFEFDKLDFPEHVVGGDAKTRRYSLSGDYLCDDKQYLHQNSTQSQDSDTTNSGCLYRANNGALRALNVGNIILPDSGIFFIGKKNIRF